MQHTTIPIDVYERRWKVLAVLTLSLVLVVAGNSALNVTLPTLVRDLHATGTDLQWIVDVYSLVFAGLLLPMGALGDRFGRKGMLQIGLVVFGAGSLAATFATVPWHLVVTRGVMGVGGAMIMPATLSIVTNVFPVHERARAIAVWAGFAGAGAALGPLISGLLLEHYSFGSVFFINVLIAGAALALGATIVPSSRDAEERPLDPVGALLSMAGLGALLYAIIQAPQRGWTDSLIVGLAVVAVVALGAFVQWERRSPHPMLPMTQFRDAGFSTGASVVGLTFFAMFGLFFVATQYVQFVEGYSPLQAGAATLPMAVMMVVFAPRSAGFAERFGRPRVMATGLLSVAIGMSLMATLGVDTPYWRLAVALMFLGAGMGSATAPATGAIMESLPLGKAGVGSAVNDTTREVGGSLGVAVLGSLLASRYRAALVLDPSVPVAATRAAHDSLGAALGVAAQAPGATGAVIAETARQAFVDSMGLVFLVAAAVAAGTSLLVLKVMPARTAGQPVAGAVALSPDDGVTLAGDTL